MISIIRKMTHQKDSRPIRLLYGNRIENQIASLDELEEASQNIKLQVDYVLFRTSIRLERFNWVSGFICDSKCAGYATP